MRLPVLASSLLWLRRPRSARDRSTSTTGRTISPRTSSRPSSKQTGIKVNYTTYDSNEILDAKLKTGRSGYDVVVPTASPFFVRQLAAGLYLPLDKAKLKNFGNLDPEIMAALAKYDPGNAHAIPWMWGTTGIGYNVAEIKKRMPDAPVDSLDDDVRSGGRRQVQGLRRHDARQRDRRLSGGAEVSRSRSRIPRSPRTSPRRPRS